MSNGGSKSKGIVLVAALVAAAAGAQARAPGMRELLTVQPACHSYEVGEDWNPPAVFRLSLPGLTYVLWVLSVSWVPDRAESPLGQLARIPALMVHPPNPKSLHIVASLSDVLVIRVLAPAIFDVLGVASDTVVQTPAPPGGAFHHPSRQTRRESLAAGCPCLEKFEACHAQSSFVPTANFPGASSPLPASSSPPLSWL